MTQRRLWKEQMEWSWMGEEFVWTIPSPRERTHLHQASTWADQLTVVVAVAVEVAEEVEVAADVGTLTMIEVTIVAMTDTKTTITGTEDDHLLLTTVDTDRGQDLVPTAQGAIDNGMVAVKDSPPIIFSFHLFGFCFSLILDFPKFLILPSP